MNTFITKKTVIYTLAIIASLVAVVVLFTNTLENVVPVAKNNSLKVEQKKSQIQTRKMEMLNFDKQIEKNQDRTVEFRGKVYLPEQGKKVYTEEEKIKILNKF